MIVDKPVTTPATPDGALPELPEPVDYVEVWSDFTAHAAEVERRPVAPHYTADQMHAYARAALEQQAAALQAAMRERDEAVADARRYQAEAKAARELAESWHSEARAEGYGGRNTRAHRLLTAMDAALSGDTPNG